MLAASAAGGGLSEALVLVIIAKVALALVSEDRGGSVDVGPVHFDLSVGGLIAIAMALVVLRTLLSVVQAHMAAAAQSRVTAQVRTETVTRYLVASWALQSNERQGRLQELLTTYATAAGGLTGALTTGLVSLFTFVAFFVTAFVVSPIAALIVGAIGILLGLALRPLRASVRRRSKQSALANVDFATTLTELTETMQEVRVFGVEDEIRERLGGLTDDVRLKQYRTRFLSQLVPGLYQGAALLLVAAALGIVWRAEPSDLGSLGAVVLIMLRSLSYGQAIQTSLQALHESAPLLETLRDEQDRYAAAAQRVGGAPVARIGELTFDRVSFDYVSGTPVLRDLSFSVNPGEIIGVIGPSGAGKSTLVQLILRLREPRAGRILAEGRDVADLDLRQWYRRVAFVPQDAHLFAGSIADNIRFFRDGFSDADVEQAARRAHLHDDIAGFELGYANPVGERGGQLSGGQRQRLCIARALLEAPELLVLDEPTSALDARSEALMRETIAELSPRTTVFVVAHRLSTLSVCHRIMVFGAGRLEHFAEPATLREDNDFFREVTHLSGLV